MMLCRELLFHILNCDCSPGRVDSAGRGNAEALGNLVRLPLTG